MQRIANPPVNPYLPRELNSVAALKIVAVRLLKLYILLRKDEWTSTIGVVKNYGKNALSIISMGTIGSKKSDTLAILDDCDAIKREIESAKTYDDYYRIITILHEKAIEAKNEEIRFLSNPSLRTDTYYAIIALMQTIMKDYFKDQHDRDISQTRITYQKSTNDYNERFDNGHSISNSCETATDALIRLVLLGDREHYKHAFNPTQNLFPDLRSRQQSYVVTPQLAEKYTRIIESHLSNEFNGQQLGGFDKPNQNIPLYFQPHFPRIHLFINHKGAGLSSCLSQALKLDKKTAGKSFREQYIDDPETFLNEPIPPDAAELTKPDSDDELVVPSSPSTDDLGASGQIDEAGLPMQPVAEADANVEALSVSTPPVSEQSPSEEEAANNNVPLQPQAPPSPRVSAIGAFAASSNTASRAASPANTPVNVATQPASTNSQSHSARRRRGK